MPELLGQALCGESNMKSEETATEKTAREILNRLMGQYMPHTTQPRYKFWRDQKDNRYFWTVVRTIDRKKNKMRFASGMYRYFKTRKQYVLKRVAYHNRRKAAKARAYRMYEQAREKFKKPDIAASAMATFYQTTN